MHREEKEDAKDAFECANEAAALLNCIADPQYNELKCLPLLKKLRACVRRKAKTKTTRMESVWLCLGCCGVCPAA